MKRKVPAHKYGCQSPKFYNPYSIAARKLTADARHKTQQPQCIRVGVVAKIAVKVTYGKAFYRFAESGLKLNYPPIVRKPANVIEGYHNHNYPADKVKLPYSGSFPGNVVGKEIFEFPLKLFAAFRLAVAGTLAPSGLIFAAVFSFGVSFVLFSIITALNYCLAMQILQMLYCIYAKAFCKRAYYTT